MEVNKRSLDFQGWQERATRFQKDHKKLIKIAAVVLTVIVALVFFVVKGEIQKKQEQLQLSEQIKSEQQGKNEYAKEFEEKSKDGKMGKGGLVVDISGQVKKPGVYKMNSGDRINDLIEIAGGLTEDANVDNINRASKVEDGSKVYIPKNGEGSVAQSSSKGPSAGTGSSNSSSDVKVNINTSDEDGLKQIPGVGPSMAKKIVDYRNSNGRFNSVEDLKNISGIGSKTFAKMQDYVVV